MSRLSIFFYTNFISMNVVKEMEPWIEISYLTNIIINVGALLCIF